MKLINYLPDNYKKNEESNNYKLLQLIEKGFDELEQVFQDIEAVRDIDNAFGVNLDRSGKNVLEYRSNREDEEYRKFVKLKIRANRSHGEIPLMNEILDAVLGDNFGGIEEAWKDEIFNNEVAALVANLQGSNISISDEIIKRIVAGGVKVYWKAVLNKNNLKLQTTYNKYEIQYPLCGTYRCGTHPSIVTDGIQLRGTNLTMETEHINAQHHYQLTGESITKE